MQGRRRGREAPALISVFLAITAACGEAQVGPMPVHDAEVCAPVGHGVARGGRGTFTDSSHAFGRRLVLMGGGPEDDDASRAFVESAAGGDVLILRASGSTTSYPAYFIDELGAAPEPNAALTLRLDAPSAGSDPGVLCRVANAEAIWLAGGNQWDYIGRWPATLHVAITEAATGGVSIGGTSAGAMALGQAVFDAELGSVVSAEALSDPLAPEVSVSASPLAQPELTGVMIDTHFSERDREGRLLAFLARFATLTARDTVRGIGLDEGVALLVEDDSARVFGPAGSGAWAYELTDQPALAPGSALSTGPVVRVRLAPGAIVPWPIVLADQSPVILHVEDGVLRNGPPFGSDARTGGRPRDGAIPIDGRTGAPARPFADVGDGVPGCGETAPTLA